MSTVMSDQFAGTVGATFTNDGTYAPSTGTAPKYVADSYYGVGLQFTAATTGTIDETFTATSQRIFDRVLLISATPTVACDFLEARTSGGNTCKAGVSATGKLTLKNAAGTQLTGGASSNVLPIGTRFRVVINMNGTSLTAIIYNNDVDNTVLENLNPTGTITSASPTISREGFTSAGMGAGVTLTMFWPQDGDTTIPGPRPVTPAAGSLTLGGSANWTALPAGSLNLAGTATTATITASGAVTLAGATTALAPAAPAGAITLAAASAGAASSTAAGGVTLTGSAGQSSSASGSLSVGFAAAQSSPAAGSITLHLTVAGAPPSTSEFALGTIQWG